MSRVRLLRVPVARGGGLRPFGHRAFRLLWSGQAVSLVGTWMQQVAQSWLVLELTGDPVALGLVGAAQFAPVLVLGLFGGLAADAFPKRSALIATNGASLVLALALGLLTFAGLVEVWHVLVLALLLGAVNAFDMPIRQSFVIEMVGREDLPSAVALNSALFNGTRIIGPAVAGLLIAGVGLAACFLINAASYAAVIVTLLLVRPGDLLSARPRAPVGGPRKVLADLGDGLRYVRATPVALLAISLVGLVSVAALNFGVALPLVTQALLGGGPALFGFLVSVSGVGSLLSAVAIAFGGGISLGRLTGGASLVGGGTLVLAFSGWLPLSLVAMLVIGWGLISMAATTNTILQLETPDALRGRVMSIYTTVFAGSAPFGMLFTGVFAAAVGISLTLAVGGGVALLAAAGAAAWLRRHPLPSGGGVRAGSESA